MARLVFTKDNLPTPEEFRQLLLEAMVASNPVDELLELAEGLGEYERQYELSSFERLYFEPRPPQNDLDTAIHTLPNFPSSYLSPKLTYDIIGGLLEVHSF